MSIKDQLFANPLASLAAFRFDAAVVAVFEDMIKRSVPGYEAIITMIGELSERYAQDNTFCYDLGCSLGAASLAMAESLNGQGLMGKSCKIIAVDNSAEMIQRCQQLLAGRKSTIPIEVVCDDVCTVPISNASIIVLNFTLQFIALEQRQGLIKRLYQALVPGGVLILSEKICFDDIHHQQLMIKLHHNFKRANGYSDLEIAQKRTALENVLIPETLQQHRERFLQAGFKHSDVWFQCFNFASILAVK
jgi:tRNA (cmo5U34)-methyltransferase